MRLLLIILTIYTTSYGSYHSNYGNYHHGYNNVSIEQTYQQRRIGYTTNYGNSFGQSTYNYRQTYYGTYKPYTPGYTTSTNTHRPGGGPRRSAQRPFSGNFLEDLADWWRIYTDSDWPGYVDPDYWDEFLADYPEYEDEAREWYENQGIHFPGDPDDPYPTPLGDFPIELAIGLFFIYWLYILIKKKPFDNDERTKIQSRRSSSYST